jgi:DNA ligase (NAD+)
VFYDKLGVRDAADLYHLTAEQLSPLEGFQEKKIGNLLDALEESKHCALSRFLLAIGIPNIGRRTARDLSAAFGTLEKVRAATAQELLAIDEVGEIVAQSVADFFSFPENQVMIERLLNAGVSPHADAAASGGAFQGMTLVVTGTLPHFSRQEAEAFIRDNGGTASGSVSKKTAYVVAGENAGSKLSKAQALGVPVIGEEEMVRLAQSGEIGIPMKKA